MKLGRSLYARPAIVRGERCTRGAIAGANGGRQVADIAKVLDGSGGHGESLDAGTEPARPLMGHSGGQRDRASARSPLGGSNRDTPAILARVTLAIDAAARSRSRCGRAAEVAWRTSRRQLGQGIVQRFAANLLHDGGESGGMPAVEGF